MKAHERVPGGVMGMRGYERVPGVHIDCEYGLTRHRRTETVQ